MNTVWLNVWAYIKTWSHILQKNHYPFLHGWVEHFENTTNIWFVKISLLKLNSFEFDEHSHAFLQGKSCDQPTEINDECALLVIYTSDHP